jgi:hypothetical protein
MVAPSTTNPASAETSPVLTILTSTIVVSVTLTTTKTI